MILLALLFSVCMANPVKVSPSVNYETDTGFRFRAAMSGDWYRAEQQSGNYLFGKRPGPNESTVLVEVLHGRFVQEPNGVKGADSILKKFQKDMSEDTLTGGFKLVNENFDRSTFRGAECMRFNQVAEDAKKRTQTMKGIVCIHPKYDDRFIRMTLSQRVPGPNNLRDYSSDEEALVNSLEFL